MHTLDEDKHKEQERENIRGILVKGRIQKMKKDMPNPNGYILQASCSISQQGFSHLFVRLRTTKFPNKVFPQASS